MRGKQPTPGIRKTLKGDAAAILIEKLKSASGPPAGHDFTAGGGELHFPGLEKELQERREITVTGHTPEGKPVSQFIKGQRYRLWFRVGAPTSENLAAGDTAVEYVPKGGLKTHWVVTSSNVEFIPELTTCEVQKVGNRWRAEFELLIPESGSSETEEIGVFGAEPGNLLVTIYTTNGDGCREIYRALTVSLAGLPVVCTDEIIKSPQYTHMRTTHEWTTPPEQIQVFIMNGTAIVTTARYRLEKYHVEEDFEARVSVLAGAIDNVRGSLERFRELQENYLEDLDHTDMAARLSAPQWQPYGGYPDGWQPLPNHADAAHQGAFAQVQQTDEWRNLASDGYALFDRCFPQGTKLRDLLKKILPGSRVDFLWNVQKETDSVSHVPWALMYMEPVDVMGGTPVDPEKFLGFRFRIGTRPWRVNNTSIVLGGPDTAHFINLLYWGRKPGDRVAEEAQWQAQEYGKSRQARVLPDIGAPHPKQQIKSALHAPGPSPVAVIYFYCHCSVGDGSRPCLRFGNTSKSEDTLDRFDLSQESIPEGPLVFANACTTAQADPHLTSVLEQSFFQRGVRAFVGTESKVPIRLASKFAWLYFQFLYRQVDPAPMSAGEALTQARMFLWTQYKNVGGLFYSMSNQYDLYLISEEEARSLC